ncbi:MAG TPA: lactate utilization protein C [Pyrinomonadaceae bacterium]|nr:lactate utilization protein C [Pyrinomonadaceae bacterium]
MDSRETILSSIRKHLAASVPNDEPPQTVVPVVAPTPTVTSLVALFRDNVEAVNGHCIVARNEAEVRQAVTQILTVHGARRIAISDAPALNGLIGEIAPGAKEIFEFDVGITTAQAAIAETGTLLLDSARERHRLASLVPPVHIAIVNASSIFQTLAEALAFIRKDGDISPAVTFITGPSRTADIELTLAIGVHGPQELYVIINGA